MLNIIIFIVVFLVIRELNKKGVFDSLKKDVKKAIRHIFTKRGALEVLACLAVAVFLYIFMIMVLGVRP